MKCEGDMFTHTLVIGTYYKSFLQKTYFWIQIIKLISEPKVLVWDDAIYNDNSTCTVWRLICSQVTSTEYDFTTYV